MFDQGEGGGRGGGFMPFFSPWYLVARMLGGAPTEKVEHNPVTQILIPCLRALMGGAGICIVIVGYVSASYVWHRNVALSDLGRAALPLLVFGLSGAISAAIGIFHDPPENYWGSRQSMLLIFGVASFALCYVFTGIAVKDPEGVLFWEIVESSCFVGLATVGFLLAIWGIVEQLIVYQMTESQRTGWGVIKKRLDEKIPTGMEAQAAEPEEVVKEWRISITVTPKTQDGRNGRPVGPNTMHFNPKFVTDDKFAFWVASVLVGEDIGYPTWVATKRFGRKAYDHLMEVLTAKGYVAKRGAARNAKLFLTVEGKRVLRAWLAAWDAKDMATDADAGNLEYEDDDHTYEGDWDVDEYPANST
jgi:hypothetical protein